MAKKKHNKTTKTKVKTKTKEETSSAYFLTVCGDCRIRLIVSRQNSFNCNLCSSTNISREAWR